MSAKRALAVVGLSIWLLLEAASWARAEDVPSGAPSASLDLRTQDGAAVAGAVWRFREARLREIEFRAAGPDRKPSGPANRTHTFEPLAGVAGYDDSDWPVIAPTSLEDRRGSGQVSFAWYRLHLVIPERIGAFQTRGATVVFETVVDDYAEVWVDGRLPRDLGQSGGSLVAGFNVPNRRLVLKDARPGQTVEIAIFAANGPLSDPPPNYIWVRRAVLEFYREPHAVPPTPVDARIEALAPAFTDLVPEDARVEKLAEGFAFTEGPLWIPDGAGRLLFSDPNRNRIYAWTPDGALSVFRAQSGYQGVDIAEYGQPGSNGLARDPRDGALTIAEHGNHRIARLEPDGSETILAASHQGGRLNSPNDLVFRSDGTLYFTDPPFGLPKFHDDPRRELPYTGVFKLSSKGLELVSQDLRGPNGLAFSPDEKILYVSNWDERHKVVTAWDVAADGSLSNRRIFADLGAMPGEEALDGLKVDARGNVWVSGPGALWIYAADGTVIGKIVAPELPANFAWGDADHKTLYLTARTGLYRLRTNVGGSGTWSAGKWSATAR